MPANDFENRIQQKLEELKLHPGEPVWENIEKEIRRKKERRRMLILIPTIVGLLLAGYGGYYFMRADKKPIDRSTISILSKKETVQPVNPEKNNTPVSQIKEDQSGDQNKLVVAAKNKEKEKNQLTVVRVNPSAEENKAGPLTNKKNQAGPVPVKPVVKEEPKNSEASNSAEGELKKELVAQSDKKEISNSTTEISIPTKETEKPIKENSTPTKEIQKPTKENSTPTKETEIPIKENSTQTKEIEKPAKETEKSINEISTPTTEIEKPAKRISTQTKQAEKPKKEIQKPVKEMVNEPFSPHNTRPSVFSLAFSAGSADLRSNTSAKDASTGVVVGTPNYYNKAKLFTHSGFAYKAGINWEKGLSRNLSFLTGLQYAYYSYQRSVGSRVFAPLQVVYGDIGYQSFNNFYYGVPSMNNFRNQFHFLELPLELEWSFNPKNKLAVSIDGGVSVSTLLGTNALVYDTTAGGVYIHSMELFNKMHLNLLGGVNLDYKQWSVGPRFSMDLTDNVKQGTDLKQSLLAFYVQLRYRFKSKSVK